MRSLERENGYFQTWDPASGRRIEGETRMCQHCQYMWIYNPKESFDRKIAGKPVQRGVCLKCRGPVCARPECLKRGCRYYLADIEEMENKARKMSPGGILLG